MYSAFLYSDTGFFYRFFTFLVLFAAPFKSEISEQLLGEKKTQIFLLKKDSIAHHTKIFMFPGPGPGLNDPCGPLPSQVVVIL